MSRVGSRAWKKSNAASRLTWSTKKKRQRERKKRRKRERRRKR